MFLYNFDKQVEKIDMEKMSWKDVVQKLGEFSVLPERTTPDLKLYLQEMYARDHKGCTQGKCISLKREIIIVQIGLLSFHLPQWL